MTPRFRLTTKILLLAAGNVAALALLFLVFVRWQLGQDFESFLMTTARERIVAEARSIALEMRDSDSAQWSNILAEHSRQHGVTFSLVQGDGNWIAGARLQLPQPVLERIRLPIPPGGGGGPGRMRGGPPPGMLREVPPARTLVNYGAGPFLDIASNPDGFDYWVSMRTFIPPSGPFGRPERGVLIIASPTLLTNPFFFQLTPWLLIGVGAILVSFLCWLPLVRGLTGSITQMTAATAKIAEGDFDTHLEVSRRDELGLLGSSINRMASRLGAFTHGQKRFLGDVAHELRSPLGRMQLALGILDRKVDASGAEYIKDLADDVKVMSGLTDGLLEFAKAEMRQDSVQTAPLNLSEIVWRAVKAESRPDIEIDVDVDPLLMVDAEPESLFRALANVIRNAVRYAGDAGPIRVRASRQRNKTHLCVLDSGPGVPAESLDQIFEPFYRLEYARDRESGGAGLGLAIVKSCIEACNGRVICRNLSPHGLEVCLVLTTA